MKRPSAAIRGGHKGDKGAKKSKKAEAAAPTETDTGNKGTALNSQMSSWVVDSDKRDKGKGEKWAKMRAVGQLPSYIAEMYDNPPAEVSARSYRTAIINRLFARQADGPLRLKSAV